MRHLLRSTRSPRTAAAALVVAVVTLAGCGSTVPNAGTGGQTALVPGNGIGVPAPDALGQAAPAATAGGGVAGSGAGVAPGSTGTSGQTVGGANTPGSVAGSRSGSTTGSTSASGDGSVPAKGRGWDEKTVSIGVMTQKDVQAVAEGFGLNSVDAGDQEKDVEVVIADLNARGGLFGRKIVAEFYDIASAGDAESQGQAACSHFTQDVPVIAVYAMALVGDVPSFRACMKAATVPVLAAGGQAFDDKVFDELDGYYTLMTFPSWSTFAGPFLDRLVAQNFYSGWNTSLGGPGNEEVKTGFLCPDTPIGRRVGALVRKESARIGRPLANETYFAAGGGDASGYVLQFKADGITHVLFCDLGLFVFAQQAESQRYRPRYGVSTFNTPVLFLQGLVPDAQLVGSMGVGWAPTLDVDYERDPRASGPPGEAACRDLARKRGLTYAPDRRLAQGILYDTCDILALIVRAAEAAGSLTGPGIRQGLGLAGPRLKSAYTWVSGLSPTERANPAATRDIAFDTSCRCYRYRGGLLPLR